MSEWKDFEALVHSYESEPVIAWRLSGLLTNSKESYAFLEDLRTRLRREPHSVILNLEKLDHITSAGIGIIAAAFTSASSAKSRLVICALPKQVETVVLRENSETPLPRRSSATHDTLRDPMGTLLSALFSFVRAALRSRTALALENAALRQQLALHERARKRLPLRAEDRAFWVLLRRLWSGWDRALFIVRPATVIAWHRRGWQIFWRRRSQPGAIGRPRIPRTHIGFIQRISRTHPEWGEDRIAEELAAKLGVHHSGSTVRRYMVPRGASPGRDQSWRTFIQNHATEVWACDFLTQHTAFFAIVYVFVVLEIGSRRVVHVNVTTNPTLAWVKQQLRDATAWGSTPRFLVHDNDAIFGQLGGSASGVQQADGRRHRCHLDRWLHKVLGIQGLPIPFRAPNANAHLERFNRTLRHEALNHFLFVSVDHVRRVVTEYVLFYNRARASQAIHRIPDPYPELAEPPPTDGVLVALPILGGIQHDYRLAA